MRMLNQEILAQAGYDVVLAEDGARAWELITSDEYQFELILLDKHMPKLDGLGLLEKLKSDPAHKEIPVIMLTSDNYQQQVSEGLKAGASYYLTKPSADSVVRQVVRKAISELKFKRELQSQIGRHAKGLQSMKRAEFEIRTIEEAKSLAIVLADAGKDPLRSVNGYSELLLNAIEHGNLGITYDEKSQLLEDECWLEEVEHRLKTPPYCDRKVSVLLARHSGTCTITICDQGKGFEWQKYLEFDPERAFDLHGRGIALAKSSCLDDIRYVGCGNTVIITVLTDE